jgi:hypothetical protein
MALNIGIRYAMAGNAEGLAEWRQQHLGAVPISLELKDGSEFLASLENVEPGSELVVEIGDEIQMPYRIPQDEVDGFTLLDPEPPLDRGDEARGEP